MNKLFLLIYDDDTSDYILYGIFDDNEESRKIIDRIVEYGCGYKIISGQIEQDVVSKFESGDTQ